MWAGLRGKVIWCRLCGVGCVGRLSCGVGNLVLVFCSRFREVGYLV